MKLTANVYELASQASFVAGNVPSKTPDPMLRAVHIKAVDDSLTMAATDRIAYVRQTIPANVETSGEVYVDAILLSSIISSMSGEGEIRLSLKKKLAITKGKQRRSMTPMVEGEFSEEPKVEFQTGWDQSAQSFLFQAEKVAFATAQDMSRPILTGINIDMKNGLMVGSDGRRMAFLVVDMEPAEIGPVFTTRFIQEVKRSGMGGKISISIAENWIRAISEDMLTVVWAKALIGVYPTKAATFAKEMPNMPGIVFKLDKSALADSARLAVLYADQAKRVLESEVLYIIGEKGKIRVEMSVPSIADLKDAIPGEVDGDATIKVHPQYLLDAVNHVYADTVEIKVLGPDKPMVITDPNSLGWAVIQVPMVSRETQPTSEEPKPKEVFLKQRNGGDF